MSIKHRLNRMIDRLPKPPPAKEIMVLRHHSDPPFKPKLSHHRILVLPNDCDLHEFKEIWKALIYKDSEHRIILTDDDFII